MTILLIACLAFFGGILRYLLGMIPAISGGFPIGTLLANYAGCFLLTWLARGLLSMKGVKRSWQIGVATGFCGGLTTFSTFALDTVRLLMKGQIFLAVLYLGSSIVGGLFFIWLGEHLLSEEGWRWS